MNQEQEWSQLHGIDTDGITIWKDLHRLAEGRMSEDEASELLCDLVRDYSPSTAGYAAVPFLIENCENDLIALKTRSEMIHTACLILGLASSPDAPQVPESLVKNFSEEIKKQALQKLFLLASQEELGEHEVVCITSAALLLKGHRDAFDSLVSLL